MNGLGHNHRPVGQEFGGRGWLALAANRYNSICPPLRKPRCDSQPSRKTKVEGKPCLFKCNSRASSSAKSMNIR